MNLCTNAAEREGIKNIRVDTHGAHLRVSRRWFGTSFIVLIIFVIILDAWIISFYYESRASGFKITNELSLIFEDLAIMINYVVLALCLNKTHLLIDQKNLKVTHKPLPWTGNYLIL